MGYLTDRYTPRVDRHGNISVTLTVGRGAFSIEQGVSHSPAEVARWLREQADAIDKIALKQ